MRMKLPLSRLCLAALAFLPLVARAEKSASATLLGVAITGCDPAAWNVVNGKLDLNHRLEIQKKREGDVPGNIAQAEGNWPTLLKK